MKENLLNSTYIVCFVTENLMLEMYRKTKKEVRFTFLLFNPNIFRNSAAAD